MSTPKPPRGIPLYRIHGTSSSMGGSEILQHQVRQPETEGEAAARAMLQVEPTRGDWVAIAINVGVLVMGILIGWLLRGGAR